MTTIKTRLIGLSAALVLGVSGAAFASSQAEAATGTVNSTEARKLIKEVTKQKCLTIAEANKIVHGSGKYDENSSYFWPGQRGSRIDNVTIAFPGRCIKWVTVARNETTGPQKYVRPSGKMGTVTKAESRKLTHEMIKQKCLSWGEARKIAHGVGDSEDTLLQWPGAKGSNIKWFSMEDHGDGCLVFATVIRK